MTYGESKAKEVKFPMQTVTNGTPAWASSCSSSSLSRGTGTLALSSAVYGSAKSEGAKSFVLTAFMYGTSFFWSNKPSGPTKELFWD